jgi:hypothetical protein
VRQPLPASLAVKKTEKIGPGGIRTGALLCFDKDSFAYNSTMKVKLKILERVYFMLYLLVFELSS